MKRLIRRPARALYRVALALDAPLTGLVSANWRAVEVLYALAWRGAPDEP